LADKTLNPLPKLGIKLLEGGILDYVQTEDRKYIRYGFWDKGEKATVIILPGRSEYIEKYNSVIKEFTQRNYSVVCIDWRGQGLSQRPLGRTDIGHVKNFFEYQIDLESVLSVLQAKLSSRPLILFGHSMGGCIGLRYLLRSSNVSSAIFSGPLWGLPVSDFTVSILIPIFNLAISLGLGLLTYPYKIDGFQIINKAFEKNILTRNAKKYQEMRENLLIDPRLGLGPPTLSWLVALNAELKKLAKMPPPDIPQLTLVGEEDMVVSKDSILARMARTPKGYTHIIQGAYHEIFFETKEIQEDVWQKIDEFLDAQPEKSSTH
tara:strand:+ start:1038 stop:1997 length:960 start_codon:yes stop_codon:yes gene_type:complete